MLKDHEERKDKYTEFNAPSYCNCLAHASVQIDRSIKDMRIREEDFYQKAQPCFDLHYKPAFDESCEIIKQKDPTRKVWIVDVSMITILKDMWLHGEMRPSKYLQKSKKLILY